MASGNADASAPSSPSNAAAPAQSRPVTDVHTAVDRLLSGAGSLQDVAQSLSNNGWSIDAVRDSLTPLSRGVQAQHHELVSLLLDRKADFNRTDSKGVHPVHMAVFGGNQDIIRQLICAKVDVNSQDRHGQTPLFFAPCKEICQQLSAASANVHALNSKGQSPLHLAAFAGLSSVVSWLVVNMKQGAIDQQDKHGRTALYCACGDNSSRQ